jgi:hypothetical protein
LGELSWLVVGVGRHSTQFDSCGFFALAARQFFVNLESVIRNVQLPQGLSRDYDWSLGQNQHRDVGSFSSDIGGEAGHSSLPLVCVTIRVTSGENL